MQHSGGLHFVADLAVLAPHAQKHDV